MPLGKGAGSRAIAAFLPAAERRALVDRHFAEFTTAGIGATKEAVAAELGRVRRAGVAIAFGEVTPGLVGIASPILASDAMPQGALCLSADAEAFDADGIKVLADEIRASAGEISAALDATRADGGVQSERNEVVQEKAAFRQPVHVPVGDEA